jgi:hypothetical protein
MDGYGVDHRRSVNLKEQSNKTLSLGQQPAGM